MTVETLAIVLGRFALLAVLVVSAWTDWRSRRIPNVIAVLGLFVALGWHLLAPAGAGLFDRYLPGALGLREASLGASCAFIGFLVLHGFGLVGAGDVKLMTAVGAFAGLDSLPGLVLLVFCCGGVLALCQALIERRLIVVLRNVRGLAYALACRLGGWSAPLPEVSTEQGSRMPFALAIASGSAAFALASWWDLIV